MAKPLQYQPLPNFGVNGLNTQNNPAVLDPSWLTSADNIVLRESGRISFRKGFKQKTLPSGTAIGSITEHYDVAASGGGNKIFASYGTSIYTVDFTTPQTPFPSSGVDIKHTVTASTGNWQFVNFNKRLDCFHAGIVPQRYAGASDAGEKWSAYYNATAINDGSNIDASQTTITVDSTTGFPPNGKILIESEIISYTGIDGTHFTGCTRGADSTTAATHNDDVAVVTATKPAGVTTFDPSCGMGFYGRMYVGGVTEEKDVVYYSVLLDSDDFTGTGSGLIDLKTVWGTDEIVAIAPFFGKLIIFGKNNIAIYNNPEDIANATLDEVIRGIGLVNRDAVQAVGDDLVFLSETGLRSLARTTEKDKLPLTDYSLNIKDTIIRNIGQSTNVKSVYVENEGIYILSFTDKGINYVFDFKHFTPNKVPRVTTWSFNLDREPASMVYTELYSGLLVGQKDGGIAGYEGYFDADLKASVIEDSTIVNWALAPATHSITEKKVGSSSIYFNGTLPLLTATADKFNIGTGNFTFEAWVYPSGTDGWEDSDEQQIFRHQDGSYNGYRITYDEDYLYFYRDSSSTKTASSAHGLTGNTWAHIAVTKTGNGSDNIEFWVNGISKGTATWSGDASDTTVKLSNGNFGYSHSGYIDEPRYSKIARYSSTFTPSTTEFEYDDDDTILLIHSNKAVTGSTTFIDSSVNPLSTHLNAPYIADISSPWIELGQTMSSSLLKKMILVLEGGSGANLGLKWYKDFSSTSSATTSISLNPTTTGSTSLWGDATSLYGTSTYSPVFGLQEYRTPLTGSARNLKLNLSIESNGYDASIQDLTLLHKEGKIR